ncbi:MAG TPA: (Fe-S)-binding protein [Burkholderiales bacterium]|jgi:Fe-S oxidoreductase|nr:(Fe-S)-binding protein [Burkholderiales bacterium]
MKRAEFDFPGRGVERPAVRYDKQGDASDAERVERAMQAFARDMTRTNATYLESCIRCGHCAEACHFYTTSHDPQYTPIWKLEPFKRAWKGKKVSANQLRKWQELLYDSCTMCGRCTLACPMGIDIAGLVAQARHAMFAAGLVPHELHAVAERAEREGSPLGATPKVLKERIEWLADEHEVDISLDRPQADVLITLSSIEIMKYPMALVSLAKILNRMGASWTIRSDGYEATNFGLFSGNLDWQRDMSLRMIQAAIACRAKTLVLPECGHAYGAMRWQGANMYGKPLPFRVLHISEFLAEAVREGKLGLKRLEGSITFHDPCQVSRRGGATTAPREVLASLQAEVREMPPSGDANWCCGGGGGVVTLHRADEHRYRAFEIKIAQVEASGAERMATSCSNCRLTFDDGAAHFKWDRKMESLLEVVADQLD